jgi:hypothetical protein
MLQVRRPATTLTVEFDDNFYGRAERLASMRALSRDPLPLAVSALLPANAVIMPPIVFGRRSTLTLESRHALTAFPHALRRRSFRNLRMCKDPELAVAERRGST